MPDSGRTTRTIIWALAALFAFTVAAATAIYLLAPEPDNAVNLVATLLANLSALIAVIVNLQRTGQVADKVDSVRRNTHDLVNGLLDAKVRAGVAEVIHPDLVDPTYADPPVPAGTPDLSADLARRAAARDDATPPPAAGGQLEDGTA